MAKRSVEVIECDGCGVKVEYDKDNPVALPPNWRHITMLDVSHSGSRQNIYEFDVHSPGCGERAAIRAIRNFYGMGDDAEVFIDQLDPIPPPESEGV